MFRKLLDRLSSALRPVPRARRCLPYRPRLEALEDRAVPAFLQAGFRENPLATGLRAPTAMEIAPDGRIFICEQGGTLRVHSFNRLQPTPALTLNVDSQGERGLLGVAVDPNYLQNKFVYLYYTLPDNPNTAANEAHNRVSRFTMNGDTVVAGSARILLRLDPLVATNHNGGAIHFGADGKLYVAVGDAGVSANSQSLATRFGKMLRINADGTIPADNPFVGVQGANPAIWALGLRNPFTFGVQRGTGRIFINDVGAAQWEEINDGLRGANYGWPNTEGPTNDPRFKSPVYAYVHGGGECAIVGGAFYNPTTYRFPFEFHGTYFFADLCGGWINYLNPRTGQVKRLASGIAAPVDLHVSSSGLLYYLARGTGANTGVLVSILFKDVDLNWLGGGISVPATASTNTFFTVNRTYHIAGSGFESLFGIRYVASQDTTLGNADDLLLGHQAIFSASGKTVGLHSGTSHGLRIARPGRWFIFAVVDGTNYIPEVNEVNNVIRSSTQIVVT